MTVGKTRKGEAGDDGGTTVTVGVAAAGAGYRAVGGSPMPCRSGSHFAHNPDSGSPTASVTESRSSRPGHVTTAIECRQDPWSKQSVQAPAILDTLQPQRQGPFRPGA